MQIENQARFGLARLPVFGDGHVYMYLLRFFLLANRAVFVSYDLQLLGFTSLKWNLLSHEQCACMVPS